MPSVEKSVARRTTDTSRSSDRDGASTVDTTAIEGKRETELTVAYSPKKSHDLEAEIEFVDCVIGPRHLSDSWRDSDNIQSLESWDDSNTFESPLPIEVPDIWCDSENVPPIVSIEIPESCSQRQKRRESKLLTWSQGLLSVQLGLVIFISTSAYRYVKISRRGNARFDGEMMILRAYLLYLPKLQEQMEKCRRDTDPELEDAKDALLRRLPFFRYAVPYWMLHGGRVQRTIHRLLSDMEIENMHMTVRRDLGIEKAIVYFDQQESATDILKSIEDGFSPIFLGHKSALGSEFSETSKIREVLLELIIDDDARRQTYKTALETMSPGKLESNFHVLLGSFAYDLQEEAHTIYEYGSFAYDLHGEVHKIHEHIYETALSYLCMYDDNIRQPQLQLPDTRGTPVSILSALSSSQIHGKRPNVVHQLKRLVTNGEALATLRTSTNRFAEPTTSSTSSAASRHASAAVLKEVRSPMLEEVGHVLSNASQDVEDLDICQAAKYRPLASIRFSARSKSLRAAPVSRLRPLEMDLYLRKLFFRDFALTEVSSAYGLRDLLLLSGYQAALFVNRGSSQAAAQGHNFLRQSSTTSVDKPGSRPGVSSDHTAKPSNRSQILGGNVFTPDDPSEVLKRDNGSKAMWILICFYYNRHVSQAVHLDTQDGDDDVSLIKHARQKHFEKRGWFAYYMSWKAVTKIAFVKFGYILDPIIEEGLALLHEDWVPPEGWKDTKLWEPCPAEPRPVAEQRFLLHLWNHPHHSRNYLVIQRTKLRLIAQAKSLLTKWRIQQLHYFGWLRKARDQYKRFRGWNTSSEQLPFSNPNNLLRMDDRGVPAQRATGKGRYLFKSTPKRLEKELQAHLDEPPLGWGLHFEETTVVPAPLRYMGIFIIIAMILSAIVSALVLIHEKGVAYFGMGNFGIGIAAVVTTLVMGLMAV